MTQNDDVARPKPVPVVSRRGRESSGSSTLRGYGQLLDLGGVRVAYKPLSKKPKRRVLGPDFSLRSDAATLTREARRTWREIALSATNRHVEPS